MEPLPVIDALSKEQLTKLLDNSIKTHVEFMDWINKNYPVIIREWEKYKQYKYKLMIGNNINVEEKEGA